MPSFSCKYIGMTYPFEVTAKTEDALMKKIADHAAKVHNMKPPFPADVMANVKKASKNRY